MDLSLLERFRPLLRLQVRRLQLDPRLRRRFDSSDLIQEALTRAVSHADQLRGQTEAEAFGWVQQILRTVTCNAIERETAQARDYRVEVPIDGLLADSSIRVAAFLAAPVAAPDDRAARCELLLRLAEAIERLPPDQQDAVNLRRVHGYDTAAIAALLGKTEKAVAGLLRRGYRALRQSPRLLDLETP